MVKLQPSEMTNGKNQTPSYNNKQEHSLSLGHPSLSVLFRGNGQKNDSQKKIEMIFKAEDSNFWFMRS